MGVEGAEKWIGWKAFINGEGRRVTVLTARGVGWVHSGSEHRSEASSRSYTLLTVVDTPQALAHSPDHRPIPRLT